MSDIRAIDAYKAYKRLMTGYYDDYHQMEFDVAFLNEYFLEQMRKEGTL